MNRVRVLVLDASARQSLAACRSLGRAGHEIGAAGYRPTGLAGYSRYTTRYHELPSPFGSEGAFIDALEGVIAAFGYTALVATDDATLARLNGCPPSIPTVPALGEPFTRLTDKRYLAELARQHGVDYPETYPADTAEQIETALRATGLPAIVKAERSAVARPNDLGWHSGARVVHDSASGQEAAAMLAEKGLRPIVQRRVRWSEKINVVIIRRGGRSELRYAHRVLREIPPRGGMGIAMETMAPDERNAALSLRALEQVCDGAGYEGLAQAELYVGEGRAWLIDVNPRLWGSTWFAERLGLRVAERALRAALDQPPLADADYPVGRRFHHVPQEWRWIFRQPPAWRSLLEVARGTRPGDLFEYIDWSDLGALTRYARDRGSRVIWEAPGTLGYAIKRVRHRSLRTEEPRSPAGDHRRSDGTIHRISRVLSLATVAPAVGLRAGLQYRHLVRQQRVDRMNAVYEFIWRDAAERLAVEMTSRGDGTFTFRTGERLVSVTNLHTPLDGPETVSRAFDKPEVDSWLAALDIPVPRYLEFRATDPRGAFRFLAEQGGPCVVKPAASAAGFGVTCGVRTRTDLAQALTAAAAFGRRLMIERQVGGDVYRFLFLDGVLLDVVRRRPSHVTGDGKSTVLDLVAAENRRRVRAEGHAGLMLIRPDLDCILALRAVGLRPQTVLRRGFRIAVKTSNGDGGEADTETVVEPVSAALIDQVAAAVHAVGARLAGVDVAAPDLAGDLKSSGGAVIEVNVPPGLQYHYLVAEPARAVHVAVPILRRILETSLD